MSEQLFLDLSFPTELPSAEELDDKQSFRKKDLIRAVMAWLVEQQVAGLAPRTPTRRARYSADIAAFWSVQQRDKQKRCKLITPCRTCIVECRGSRDQCWPDCTDSADLLPQLRDLRREALELQSEIRIREPQLRAGDALFEEFSEWNYEKSANPRYQDVRRQIETFETALYQGTRFESMRNAGLADLLYLAVPEKTVHPHELAEGWGLLWVKDDLSVVPIQGAIAQTCTDRDRLHLVQNIASAASRDVLFAHGIDPSPNAPCRFRPIPRRRRVCPKKGS